MVELTITFSIGAIIGWIIREIVSDRLARDRAIDLYRVTEFNKATAVFRVAFLPETAFLKDNTCLPECERPYTTLNEFLRAGYTFRHLKALNTFKGYLPSEERMAIDRAWEKYCNFAQYSDKNNEAELKKVALENIEEILKFAKHK